ncbi:hypothetical protein [Clostridium luticellarii]|uniref:Uncharacterized protein n=1 Tax=Clostridium luticellarii TaxID=1691940 RepID=A0A2T0BNS1_9CLOT|nr:hypothetical protein [Clostridium luticellarii]PRR85516.1 hypothetical protein CLLU_14370 [Clostridium luticellarii]
MLDENLHVDVEKFTDWAKRHFYMEDIVDIEEDYTGEELERKLIEGGARIVKDAIIYDKEGHWFKQGEITGADIS